MTSRRKISQRFAQSFDGQGKPKHKRKEIDMANYHRPLLAVAA
jgi:hypothetical protein